MTAFTESTVEDAALDWLRSLGWTVAHGPDLAPGTPGAERADYAAVVLEPRLRDALARLNPDLPADALDAAYRRLTRPDGATLEVRNRAFHRMVVDGVTVEYRTEGGAVRGAQARVLAFDEPDENDWLAVNQFTVVEQQRERRPDVVLFVNGLPLGIVELKNPADEDADVWTAWRQLQTYKAELPTLFALNAALIVSDGVEARIGTLTAGREWFKPWRTIAGATLADPKLPELEVLLKGVCAPPRFLALVRDFIVFEDAGRDAPVKKMAGYHQFHAVGIAVAETLRAAALQREDETLGEGAGGRYEAGRKPGGAPGDRRIGVVWHTQGSGKSLTMAFYAGRIVREPAMRNPTVVVLTDRNDLDDQLFATFARCRDLLRQPPVQADSRADLRAKLAVASGGVIFTTIQKFLPEEPSTALSRERGRPARLRSDEPRDRESHAARSPALSERRNVVVIADEAHRSQYDFIDGYARHMRDALPHAAFVGFTGTPVELRDANTRAVFGDYISIYDVQRAVEDRATVPIYYESRLAALTLDERERPTIDPAFEEATEGEETARKEQLKSRWAQLEAVVGAEPRLALVARDLVTHFEQRLEALDGKAMVVCMSRRICIALYRELVRLRPDWHAADDAEGALKIVMTGAATDPPDWQPHIRTKPRREALATRFRNPADPLRMVLVRDMWLTGFDAPSLHTMYLDKPLRGHALMQAIARVNRVFRDKPGGLVVDYLGVAHADALRIRDDVGFFQAVRAVLAKRAPGTARPAAELDRAVRQIISRAVASAGVTDVFAAAGLDKPDVSVLSDDFLAEVRGMPQRNLAVELLQKLLKGEITARGRRNVVQARTFSAMLEQTLRRYRNRAVEAAQVIEELIELAHDLRSANARGEALGLSDDEVAFYDALETSDSAVQVLGDETLRAIARELVETVRRNVTIDWTLRENVRAQLRVLVKRILRKHGYPPDKRERATRTVLEQAEVLSAGWAVASPVPEPATP